MTRAAMFALLALGASNAALAQTVIPEGVGVADRYRPEYQPVGGRIGSFFLYPTFSATAVATDNVRATNSDKRDDYYADLHADALLASNLPRHSLNVRLYVDQSVHSRLSREDVTEFGGAVFGRLDVSRRTVVTVDGLAERTADERTGYNNVTAARSPIRYAHYRTGAEIRQDLDPLTLTADVHYEKFDFRDGVSLAGQPLNQQFRDFGQLTVGGSAAYTFYPGLAVLVRGSLDERNYSLDPSDPRAGGLERDSSGGRIEAGLKVDFTSLLYGEVRIGYLERDYSDPRLRDTSGLSFGADILWNVTPLTTIRFRADRTVDEASSFAIAGNRTTVFALRVDHELLRNLILSAEGRYARIRPLGDLPRSSEYFGRFGARYLISRRVTGRLNYQYYRRTDPNIARRFTENRLTAGLALTF